MKICLLCFDISNNSLGRAALLADALSSHHDVKIIEKLVDTTIDDDVELNVKDTLTLLGEYIDEVDLQVDKSDLKTLMQSLYIEACEVS